MDAREFFATFFTGPNKTECSIDSVDCLQVQTKRDARTFPETFLFTSPKAGLQGVLSDARLVLGSCVCLQIQWLGLVAWWMPSLGGIGNRRQENNARDRKRERQAQTKWNALFFRSVLYRLKQKGMLENSTHHLFTGSNKRNTRFFVYVLQAQTKRDVRACCATSFRLKQNAMLVCS